MGDIILTTPLLNTLKKHIPDAKITYLAETPYDSLLYHHPAVDQIIALNRKSKKSQNKIIKTLFKTRYDLAIDLFGNPRSAFLTLASFAKIRIGGDFRGRKYVYTHRIKEDTRQKSAIDFHLDYLAPLNIKTNNKQTSLHTILAEEKWATDYLHTLGYKTGKTLIGIHPGATWPAKRWLPERFAELIEMMAKQPHVQVLVTVGPGEENWSKGIKLPLDILKPGVLSIRQLLAVIKKMDIFVSNDCGPMHIAPALGTKVVGIFGPGEPDIWFPYDPIDGHQLVYNQIDCSQCHKDFCDKMDCMKSITVDQVIKAINNTNHPNIKA